MSCGYFWFNSRHRIYQYNKDNFRFKFMISIKLSNSMDTHKYGNKEKLSIKLVILKKACYKTILNLKLGRLYCIDINVDHCV